jgi:subtilisin
VAAQAVQAEATSVHRELDFDDIGKVISGEFSDTALNALDGRSDVRYVEEDGQWQALAQTLPWGIDRINAEVVHNEGRTGAGASIAILDTGIDSDHPDLQGNLGPGHSPINCDSGGTGNCDKTWDDDNGHGTHVAGTANAIDNSEGVVGVSTEATLHAVKVLDENGRGSFSDVAAGLRTAADEGYDVANMSLGGAVLGYGGRRHAVCPQQGSVDGRRRG